MMRYLFKFIFVGIIVSFLLSSCQTLDKAETIPVVELSGFERVLVPGGDFVITTYQKVHDKKAPYVFYIEGDGLAFINKYTVSSNPTPRKQMLMNLAAMDKRPNVVYVGRPCQYTLMELNPKCSETYWTDKRLSDDSVAAINDVINKVNVNHQKFSLIGYSGGGGIAVLVAARNPRVKDVITIAGNLDHLAFTEYHSVIPMSSSLNPIDYAASIKDIPQWHISGANDKIVPPFIAQKYTRVSASPCVTQKTFTGVGHKEGWDQVWESIYTKPIRCYN